MPDIHYKGWLIEPQSYQPDGDRWRPKAMVSIFPVLAPPGVMFDTEQDGMNAPRLRIPGSASTPRAAHNAAYPMERGGRGLKSESSSGERSRCGARSGAR